MDFDVNAVSMMLAIGFGAALTFALDLIYLPGGLTEVEFVVISLLLANMFLNSMKEGFYQRAYLVEVSKNIMANDIGYDASENAGN